jgi:hypothetical protein
MAVEVGPEIEQFILQICTLPEQHGIQIFASNGAHEPFHEGMRQGNVADGLDLCHLPDPQIGLPLVELIERIMVGAEALWQPALTSNGAAEHATKCAPIDRAGMDAETNDPSRVLIHNHQEPVGPQVTDSQRTSSILQRLSFMGPWKVSQEGPPGLCPGQW